MQLTSLHTPRRGIAATEMALIAPVIILLLAGVWEVGRLIMVQNLLNETAREAARLAGSAGYFASGNHANPLGGTLTLIAPSTNGNYEVQKKAITYLKGAGATTTGVKVTVSNVGSSTTTKTWSYTWDATAGSGTGSGYDPAAAADQLDTIQVTVTAPYKNFAWSPLNVIIGANTNLVASAKWASMRDVPLTISTTIPSRPLQPTDNLP